MDLKQFGRPIKRGSANVWKRGEPVRGKLYLLERALVHQQEGYHLRPEPVIIALADIKEVVYKNYFGILPNGLVIYLKNGDKHTLVVNRRKHWMSAIAAQSKNLNSDVKPL